MITEVAHAFGILLRTQLALEGTFLNTVHLFCATPDQRSREVERQALDSSTCSRVAPFPHQTPKEDVPWVAIALVRTKADESPSSQMNTIVIEFGVHIDSRTSRVQQRPWFRWSAQDERDLALPRECEPTSSSTMYYDFSRWKSPFGSDRIMKVETQRSIVPYGRRCQIDLSGKEHLIAQKSWLGKGSQLSLSLRLRPEFISGRLLVAVDISITDNRQ